MGLLESCHWIPRRCQSRAAISISMNRNLGDNRADKSVPGNSDSKDVGMRRREEEDDEEIREKQLRTVEILCDIVR